MTARWRTRSLTARCPMRSRLIGRAAGTRVKSGPGPTGRPGGGVGRWRSTRCRGSRNRSRSRPARSGRRPAPRGRQWQHAAGVAPGLPVPPRGGVGGAGGRGELGIDHHGDALNITGGQSAVEGRSRFGGSGRRGKCVRSGHPPRSPTRLPASGPRSDGASEKEGSWKVDQITMLSGVGSDRIPRLNFVAGAGMPATSGCHWVHRDSHGLGPRSYRFARCGEGFALASSLRIPVQ